LSGISEEQSTLQKKKIDAKPEEKIKQQEHNMKSQS
jgi:hypothetical protein